MRFRLLLCLAAATASARADEPPPPFQRTIAIHPAKPPTPALSIRLIPALSDQIPGDAAVFYHRAIESLSGVRAREEIQAMKAGADASTDSPEAMLHDWLRLPSDEFPIAEVRRLLGNRVTPLEEARLGSLRETCDWGFRHRTEGFSLLLPDIQEMRRLARWLALKARFDAEEGRMDEALTGLRTGLASARDTARGGASIQSLVGTACAGIVLDVAEMLVQRPDCPNLYWALAAVPRPLINMSAAVEAEAALIEQEFPFLKDLDDDAWSLEAARSIGDEIVRKLDLLFEGPPRARGPLSRPAIDDLPARGAQLLMIAKDYRRSRQALRDAGLSAERIEGMPMLQVVALDSYRTYRIRFDDTTKWARLPFWLTGRGWIEADSTLSDPTPGFPFHDLIVPARQVSLASVRLERRIAALMVVESVRLYAAKHDGALPARLDDLTDAPAPPDPVTGGPFEYALEGGRAILRSPAPVGSEHVPESALRYELVPAR